MRKIFPFIAIIALVAGISIAFFTGSDVIAMGVQSGVESAKGDDQPADLFGNAGVFTTISNVLLFIVGAIAVIMLIIGGLRYVVSGGDSSQVQAAKNTILYALIGVIVAILAYAAVNFVVSTFVTGGEAGGGGMQSSSGSGVNGTSTR